ncbi:Sir2 family NAD-dependent protein deacetylase [Sporomusa termitida]
MAKLGEVAPNQGHQALAALQQKGNMVIITQNVDGVSKS